MNYFWDITPNIEDRKRLLKESLNNSIENGNIEIAKFAINHGSRKGVKYSEKALFYKHYEIAEYLRPKGK